MRTSPIYLLCCRPSPTRTNGQERTDENRRTRPNASNGTNIWTVTKDPTNASIVGAQQLKASPTREVSCAISEKSTRSANVPNKALLYCNFKDCDRNVSPRLTVKENLEEHKRQSIPVTNGEHIEKPVQSNLKIHRRGVCEVSILKGTKYVIVGILCANY